MIQKISNSFQVYTASAGSGKTFRLTLEYLKIALSNPKDKFKKILAITFTVKATNEMKDRVIEACKAFAESKTEPLTGRNLAFFETLKNEVPWSESEIVSKSNILYKKILHNYGDFSVSTIDSFSQRLIRSFAYELQLPIQFEVLIDQSATIDYLLSEAFAQVGGEDKQFTALMVSLFDHKLREDDSIRIEQDVEKAIKILFKEDSQQPIEQLSKLDSKTLKTVNERLNQSFFTTRKKVISIGQTAADLIQQNGLEFSDFSGGVPRGNANIFKYVLTNPLSTPSSTFVKLINGEGSWFTKAKRDKYPNLESELVQLGAALIAEQEKLNVASVLRKNFPQISLLAKLSNLFKKYKEQEEVLLISEFNQTIHKEVKGQPAPFIYEKVGEYYEHILLDEFQDTSVIQWQNLVPMVAEILSKESHPKSLIVGDSKQAIYRFRGGETKQLTMLPNLIGADDDLILQEQELILAQYFEEKKLDSNFRSRENIVAFNNLVYQYIAESPDLLPFKEIYATSHQKSPKRGSGGYITVTQLQKDKGEKTTEFDVRRLDKLQQQIEDVHTRGLAYGEMAVLCRSKKQLRAVAERLQDANMPIVSQESMALNQEKYITVFPAMVRWFTMPDNQVLQAQIANVFHRLDIIGGNKHRINKEIGARKMRTIQQFSDFLNEYNPALNLSALNYTELLGLFEVYTSWLPQTIQQSVFISFFRDELWSLIQIEGNNIEAFLDWWAENNSKLYIKNSDNANGVNLLTIHKSKGLEFEAVFMPFADWSYVSSNINQERRWLPTNLVDEKISFMYLPMQKALGGTPFESEYQIYKQDIVLDNLNLLYVATTRPVSELHIITEKGKADKTVNDATRMQTLWAHLFDNDVTVFGEPVNFKQEEVAEYKNELSLGQQPKQFGEATIAVKNRASAIWRDEVRDKIDFGELVHQLLAKVYTKNDIVTVIEQTVADGILQIDQTDEIRALLNEVVTADALTDFFSNTTEILAEQPIVTPTGDEFIPDRIAKIDAQNVKILDFKTGQENSEHKKQLATYANLLEQMDFNIISKQLVYIQPFKIVTL